MPSDHPDPLPQPERGLIPAVRWACFLGCSWTWVIGMIFPVLLLRDYGVAGWFVFAVPNVIGAAAMGVVLARPAWSVKLVERHRDMCGRFSEVTLAYHAFVLMWLGWRLWGWWLVAAVAVGAVLVALRAQRRGAIGVVAMVVAAASLIWLGIGLGLGAEDAWVGVFQQPVTPRLGWIDLLLFLPASVMGFLACPYLDLTFHRARQATTPGTGIAAFVLGFGVVFLAMIVGSLAYAGLLIPALSGQPFELPQTWASVLAVHLALQIAFTTGVHGQVLLTRHGSLLVPRLVLVVLAGGLIGYRAATLGPPADPAALSFGEVVYRLFLLAYGLVFPAYVWLCVIPTIRPTRQRTRLAIFAVGVVLTFPMGCAMFIAGHGTWILGIILTLVILRLFVETSPRDAAAPLQ